MCRSQLRILFLTFDVHLDLGFLLTRLLIQRAPSCDQGLFHRRILLDCVAPWLKAMTFTEVVVWYALPSMHSLLKLKMGKRAVSFFVETGMQVIRI